MRRTYGSGSPSIRCHPLAALNSAVCTRSSARWASPVSRYAVRDRAGVRATTNARNASSSYVVVMEPGPLSPRQTLSRGGSGVRAGELLSARSAPQPLDVHDHDRAWLEAQPAARREVGE